MLKWWKTTSSGRSRVTCPANYGTLAARLLVDGVKVSVVNTQLTALHRTVVNFGRAQGGQLNTYIMQLFALDSGQI